MKLFIPTLTLLAVLALSGCVNGFSSDLSRVAIQIHQDMRERQRAAAEEAKKSGKQPEIPDEQRFSFTWPMEPHPEAGQPDPMNSASAEKHLSDFFDDLERAMIKDAVSTTPKAVEKKQEDQQQQQPQQKSEEISERDLDRLTQQVNQRIQDLQKMADKVPPALQELLFGGNVSALGDDNKEVQCVVKCEPQMLGNSKFEVYGCQELKEAVNCVSKCRPGAFADFVYRAAKTVHYKSCGTTAQFSEGSFDLKKLENELSYKALSCMDMILSDLKTVVGVTQHFMQCYSEILDANDSKEACYAVKYCFIDSTISKVKSLCVDDDMAELLKFASIYSLTKTARSGSLVRNCPSLYTMN